MYALSRLALGLIALVLATTSADAQTNAWNRRISDLRIMHMPGRPAGVWCIEIEAQTSLSTGTPAPNLGYDCTLFINDVPLQVITTTVEPAAAVNNCNALCNNSCTVLLFNSIPVSGTCVGNSQFCSCVNVRIEVFSPTGAGALDLVRVTLTPTAGAVNEFDTTDDSMTRAVGENNPGTLTCAGDGTGTACPCANSGSTGHGCGNASNPTGAELTATGFVEANLPGTDSVVLHVSGMPSGAPLLYFQGTSNALSLAFGDGTLCTTGALIRLRVKINVGGTSVWPEPGDPSLSTTGGVTPGSGVTRYYQAYYRDSATYCTPATFNTTNGISLTWY